MEEKGIVMTRKDLKRWSVIEQVIQKTLIQKKASELLSLSVRQIKRIVKRARQEGPKSIRHRSLGRPSNRRHPVKLKQKVLALYRLKYPGFGPTLAQEKLKERDRLEINRETIRQWLIHEGLWEGRKKMEPHRQWRERRECFGEMVQVDGSHHDWLEGRGPKLVLMGYIDDATGHVYANFYDYEGTVPALDSLYRYIKRYGVPHSLYLDRHTTYKGCGKLSIEEELAGKKERLSEFGRAMERLGVRLIHAQSPQAKGRIERLFGTFQDRLIKEMRLEKVKTKEEANQFLVKYLPGYNRRFDKKPKSEADLHHVPSRDLKQALSIQTLHCLRRDNTVRHNKQFYQILAPWKGSKPKEIVVEERLDGKIYMTHNGRELQYRQIQEPLQRFKVKRMKPSKARRPQAPPITHPYKRRSFEQYLHGLKTKLAA